MFNFSFKLKFIEEEVVIYLIDDDEFITKILKTKFETSTNYKVLSFSSGEEFLEYVIKNKIPKMSLPIIILDYSLKTHKNYDAKDGIEILKIIKELYSDVEVIMISSFEDIDIATSSMHYGATSFVKKNENSFLRIHNTIKYTISRKKLEKTKKQSQLARKFFLILIITLIVLILFFFKEVFLK
jgi:FixJ family two-component response regulator